DSPLSTTFRRSNRKICRSQWLSTPRSLRSGRSATSPTRSPRFIACWPSRLRRPSSDANVVSADFRATRDRIYDTVMLTAKDVGDNRRSVKSMERTKSEIDIEAFEKGLEGSEEAATEWAAALLGEIIRAKSDLEKALQEENRL